MIYDIMAYPCQIACLQEANDDLLLQLATPLDDGAHAGETRRPSAKFLGVLCAEHKSSLMCCARESLARGIRILIFHRVFDGHYTMNSKGKSQRKGAVSRIMIAFVKMRYSESAVAGMRVKPRSAMRFGSPMRTFIAGRRNEIWKAAGRPTNAFGTCWRNTLLSFDLAFYAEISTWHCSL